jgi:glycosyltransferase involved in cell wall biosynthesis
MMADYAGHAFPYELSQALTTFGWHVDHVYCQDNVAPRGSLRSTDDLAVTAIRLARPFDKYSPLRRTRDEIDVGVRYAAELRARRPDVIVAANMPVLSLWILAREARRRGCAVVAWVQDIQSGLAHSVLPRPARPLARVLQQVERTTIAEAERVVAISHSLADQLAGWRGIDAARMTVIENWAPVDDISPVSRVNSWSQKHGLTHRFTFVYSGTLGKKHQPELLLDLARELQRDDADARVVLVSESDPAYWLEAEAAREGLGTLVRLPYQSFDELPLVLGSADVLVALLETKAAPYCVPSKVASYMCAARPVLANIPHGNLAAQLLSDRASAGLVSDGRSDFLTNARILRGDPRQRDAMGASGRRYAEAHFRISDKAADFGKVLDSLTPTQPDSAL